MKKVLAKLEREREQQRERKRDKRERESEKERERKERERAGGRERIGLFFVFFWRGGEGAVKN